MDPMKLQYSESDCVKRHVELAQAHDFLDWYRCDALGQPPQSISETILRAIERNLQRAEAYGATTRRLRDEFFDYSEI